MTNVQEGGTIIIGVKENNGIFERQGILPEHKKTYKADTIMDQMASFADPHIYVSVKFPKDLQGNEYCVITIEPFKEIPVLCRRNGKEVKEAGIYYRNRDGKVESALVSNSYDMRDIIERSTIKLSQRARQIGYMLPSSDTVEGAKKTLEEELKKERSDL